jgi:DNA-directed RNA polymerase subunit RPC12/RpoP
MLWAFVVLIICGFVFNYGNNLFVVIAGIGSIIFLVVGCVFKRFVYDLGDWSSSSKSLAAIARFRGQGRYPRYEVSCPKCKRLTLIDELRPSLVIKCIRCKSTVRVVKPDKNYEVSCPYCSHSIAHADLPYLPSVQCGLCGQVVQLKDGHIRKDEY